MELFDQNLINLHFHRQSQTVYDHLKNVNEGVEYIQGVKLKFIDSLKNNGTNYLLIYDAP